MRRFYEYSYMGVLVFFGLWNIIEAMRIVFGGFNELNTRGVLVSLSALILLLVIRAFGSLNHKHIKLYILIGISAILGGVLGLGVLVSLIVGMNMVIQGFKHIKVIQELPSREDIKRARSIYLEGVDEELEKGKEADKLRSKDEDENKRKVEEEILEGFKGSDDHRREIETWIVEEDFNKTDLTEAEIRAIAKQEVRGNKLSMSTLLALEELTKDDVKEEDMYFNEDSVSFKEFNIEGLDTSFEEELSREELSREELSREEGGDIKKEERDDMSLSLAELLGDNHEERK